MNYLKIFLTLMLVAGINFGSHAASYKGETAIAGGPPGTIFIAFAAQASKGGVDIEVNAVKTLTKSMLSAGKGDISFYSGVPNLYVLMKNKKAMYSKIEEAPEYADNLRSILDKYIKPLYEKSMFFYSQKSKNFSLFGDISPDLPPNYLISLLDRDYFFDNQYFIPDETKIVHAVCKDFDTVWRRYEKHNL